MGTIKTQLNSKKEQMQIAKKILLLTVFFLLLSCSKKLTEGFKMHNNKGGYTLEFLSSKNDMQDSLFVKGQVFDQESMAPLAGGSIYFYCQKVQTDGNGYFKFKIPSDLESKYFFKAVRIGYKTVVTEMIPSKKSDFLTVNFYLEEDDTPIYHCVDYSAYN